MVVDDCSTDESWRVIQETLMAHGLTGQGKVHAIRHSKNSGSAVAGWAKALRHARESKWFTLLSADDVIADVRPFLMAYGNQSDWVFGDIVDIWDNGEAATRRDYSICPQHALHALGTTYNAFSLTIPFVGSLFRVEFLKDHHIRPREWPNAKTAQDARFATETLCCLPRLTYVPEVFAYYRHHEGQESRDLAKERDVFISDWRDYFNRRLGHRTCELLRSGK
jgi:glycosyltransferase involved in cell wall biosynthesis